MKIAITSTGNSPVSKIDSRFGRCAYFGVYNSVTKSIDFIPNPGKDAEEGAGPAAVQLIAAQQVQKIVSGEFGIKIKPLLDSMKIQMIVLNDEGKTVKDVLEMLNH